MEAAAAAAVLGRAGIPDAQGATPTDVVHPSSSCLCYPVLYSSWGLWRSVCDIEVMPGCQFQIPGRLIAAVTDVCDTGSLFHASGAFSQQQ